MGIVRSEASNGDRESEARDLWSRIGPLGKTLGILATLVALITGGITIYQTFFVDKGPPRFTGDLAVFADAHDFRTFLRENEGQVVYLDTRCVSYGARMATGLTLSSSKRRAHKSTTARTARVHWS